MMQYGLIGSSLKHSFSKQYFTSKFEKEKIVGVRYDLFEMAEVNKIRTWASQYPDLRGLNVTLPFKEDIISQLDELSEEAETVGAVNTIDIRNGVWKGYNTDIFGFGELLKPVFRGHHSRAVILGTGGASKAVNFVLDKLGVQYVFASRNPMGHKQVSYGDLDGVGFSDFKLIINTTPLGTFPDIGTYPPIPYHRISSGHLLVDLVYNPPETMFLKKGKEMGAIALNGLDMLRFQADKSWNIWQHQSSPH